MLPISLCLARQIINTFNDFKIYYVQRRNDLLDFSIRSGFVYEFILCGRIELAE